LGRCLGIAFDWRSVDLHVATDSVSFSIGAALEAVRWPARNIATCGRYMSLFVLANLTITSLK